MKSWHKLALICSGALLLRLALLPFIQHPGIADPNHYYNLALRLATGHGLTIDYIWQYFNPPASLVHPDDYWMPLPAIAAAGGMMLFGHNVAAALLPFVLIGSLLPIIAYFMAQYLALEERERIFAAASVAVLPELFLSSLRSETVVISALGLGLAILLFLRGLRQKSPGSFAASGLFLGLAYLTRSDNLLAVPALLFTALLYRRSDSIQWRSIALAPALALITVSPWLLRNYTLFGTFTTPNLSRLLFLTEFRDFFAYKREFTLQTLIGTQSPGQLIGKRLFEMAANVKTMYTALDIFLPVAVVGGALLLFLRRERNRLMVLSSALAILMMGFFIYSFLLPIISQGGSFKRLYLTLLPLFVPVGAFAIAEAVRDTRLRTGVMLLILIFMTANAVELVRADMRSVAQYMTYIEAVANVTHQLPDTNGDGTITLMAQDPFMLRFYSIESVMLPMDDRDTILEVAQRYGVDYLMMPPDRPSLDPLYLGTETDARFVHVADVIGTNVKLFGFNFDAP